METGLFGKRAIVCAASAGLGRACATALARDGVDVTTNGRSHDRLEETATQIRLVAKGNVTTVAGDLTDEDTRERLVAACPEPDILVARTGLTGFVAGLSREVAPHGVTVNNLLPGFFETDRLVQGFRDFSVQRSIPVEQARAERLASIPAGRFGQPEEFGAACVFLASASAGYITGANLLMDGGRYPDAF